MTTLPFCILGPLVRTPVIVRSHVGFHDSSDLLSGAASGDHGIEDGG
jgi:hypothetical protein